MTNYVAKTNICVSCDKDLQKGDVFDPDDCGMPACQVFILERANIICKEVPDEVSDTLPLIPLTTCSLCDVKDAITALGEVITGSISDTKKNFPLEGVFVTDTESEYCGFPIVICDGVPSVLDTTTFKFVEIPMTTTIGKNVTEKNAISRSVNVEIAADAGADLVLGNADLLAMLAGGSFDNGMPADDAATVYLNSVDFVLTHLGDETAGAAFTSTTCDAEVLDIDTKNIVNLEPGGGYPLNAAACTDLQAFELTVKAGSIVRACIGVSVELAKDLTAVPKV